MERTCALPMLVLLLTVAVLHAEARGMPMAMPAQRPQPSTYVTQASPDDMVSQMNSMPREQMARQCQQLQMMGTEMIQKAGPVYARLKEACDRLVLTTTDMPDDYEDDDDDDDEKGDDEGDDGEAQASSPKRNILANIASKSVGLGCTALLKARNNGKMEWFESQSWYQKTLRMCTSLSGTSPMEIEDRMKNREGKHHGKDSGAHAEHGIGKWAKKLGGHSPVELLSKTCNKLSDAPKDHEIRKRGWFAKAERMCATVQSSSADELRGLVDRTRKHAETASGQLIKATCDSLGDDVRNGKIKQFGRDKWFAAMMEPMGSMCKKLGTAKVMGEDVVRRCEWLDKMKKAGKSKALEDSSWFQRLSSTCDWLEKKKAEAKTGQGPTVMV